MTKPLTALNAAIQSQLAVMEHVMHNLTSTINDAQDYIAENRPQCRRRRPHGM